MITAEDNKNLSYAERPHVLVIDDDARIRSLISRYLTEHGFVVIGAEDAAQARQMLERFEFDVLVVDVMMPGETGLELTKSIRETYDVPVVFLTALGETSDRLKGFEVGGDDYLPKPFEPQELVFRLQAILRRTAKPQLQDVKNFRIGPWSYDPEMSRLVSQNETVPLTDAEVTLISALAKRGGELVERITLAEECGVDPDARTIDVQITRLRRKIEEDTKNPRYLQTVRGKGYLLRVEEGG